MRGFVSFIPKRHIDDVRVFFNSGKIGKLELRHVDRQRRADLTVERQHLLAERLERRAVVCRQLWSVNRRRGIGRYRFFVVLYVHKNVVLLSLPDPARSHFITDRSLSGLAGHLFHYVLQFQPRPM